MWPKNIAVSISDLGLEKKIGSQVLGGLLAFIEHALGHLAIRGMNGCNTGKYQCDRRAKPNNQSLHLLFLVLCEPPNSLEDHRG